MDPVVQGRVHRRGKGWAYVVDVGTDPTTGRRKQTTKAGFATKREAQEALREVLAAVKAGTHVPRSTLTVEAYLREWLETMRPKVRASTHHSYVVVVDRLVRQVGGVRLQSLTPMQIESAYARLAAEGGRGGRPLAPKTVRDCHIVLHRALADAERLGLVARNAAHVAQGPAVERTEAATWTADELSRFLDHVAADRLLAAYVLLATTGMRRGEVLGLRWSDVDLAGASLSVRQTLQSVDGEIVIGAAKTYRSRRRIALDPSTVRVLEAHRRRQHEERLLLGPAWDGQYDLVFCNADGARRTPIASRGRSNATPPPPACLRYEARTTSATRGRRSRSRPACTRRS